MTFKFNSRIVGRRRYGSTTSFSLASIGVPVDVPWTNTGAGGTFRFYGGTNSYVRVANNGQFNLGSGDFTIEWWQFETDVNGAPRPWAFGPWPLTELGVSFEGGSFLLWRQGTNAPMALSKATLNKRNHFAIVKHSSVIAVYQNGVKLNETTDTYTYNLTYDLTIGYEGGTYNSQCFGGDITNFNIVNSAKYTANFTPTDTALGYDSNTRLLLSAETLATWTATKGSYTGSVSTGPNTDWINVSPFLYPAPVHPLPVVTGGTLSHDSTYYYRTFTASDSLVVTSADLTADILVVAGGGSGSYYGGGGAGGVLYYSSQTLTPATYTCAVGAGSSLRYWTGSGVGNNSQFGSLAPAIGGGAGGSVYDPTMDGGSGGGGSEGYGTNGHGIPGQGHDGGNPSSGGSGGGGAGAAGIGSSGYRAGGNGGVGTADYSDWGLATSTGHLVSGTYYYAGGGGGGSGEGRYKAAGGYGGGGAGGASAADNGLPGMANTGGGGGAAGTQSGCCNSVPDTGGSGIIIVRYLKTAVAPVPTPVVTGGTLTSDSTYYYRTFTASDTLNITTAPLNVDYLVLAGGGSGGLRIGGGGGAGGYRTSLGGSQLSLSPSAYSVIVGAGGSAGGNGNDSTLATITSLGGGYGGDIDGVTNNGNSGGSGGGGEATGVAGAGTPGQGNAGGDGAYDGAGWIFGGGGGGAGTAGYPGNHGYYGGGGGAGGAGVTSDISGTSVTYAGGGGGCFNAGWGSYSGAGGAGGGGAGGGVNGTANLGGGGGGATNGGAPGSGGSGVVVVRYLKSDV
jgi:hypothetical protein